MEITANLPYLQSFIGEELSLKMMMTAMMAQFRLWQFQAQRLILIILTVFHEQILTCQYRKVKLV